MTIKLSGINYKDYDPTNAIVWCRPTWNVPQIKRRRPHTKLYMNHPRQSPYSESNEDIIMDSDPHQETDEADTKSGTGGVGVSESDCSSDSESNNDLTYHSTGTSTKGGLAKIFGLSSHASLRKQPTSQDDCSYNCN